MKKVFGFSLILAMILFLAACGSSGEGDASSDEGNGSDGSEGEEALSGSVTIDGSSTVYPIMEGLTYRFNQEHPEVELSLNSSGSGGGFKKSTVGEIDLSNASRPIKEEEKQRAEENDVNLHEIELAYDGLSVVVSQQNDFVEELTTDQLKQIFLESSDVEKWSDLNEEWPEEDIKIFSPGHDSGTFDYWNEVILEEEPMKEGENTTLSENDNTLVTGIKNDPYAIGYFGYAYYAENEDSLRALAVENPDGEMVAPSGETIQDGSYAPLSRPLFTYVNTAKMKENEEVFEFVKFALNNAGPAAEEVGYVALNEEEYQSQLEEIKGMTE
ncbi:PstS family phosphate ABC transporter substrate-binding protein [Salimicrobium halophilum]|uniref:Phosphate-binding protein n=1 Tax=Salimicrobium halophilum TaxID=86666 RepID=A0A1G8PRT7_9BACI|nr:PstS family phosphate ABC transporter substrate-binding protein [Salimicrobium halophilum]SDI95183.1 phosphate ABC transporter substrate-binding protein, PhoT family [Salimicrobium halophilum]